MTDLFALVDKLVQCVRECVTARVCVCVNVRAVTFDQMSFDIDRYDVLVHLSCKSKFKATGPCHKKFSGVG